MIDRVLIFAGLLLLAYCVIAPLLYDFRERIEWWCAEQVVRFERRYGVRK